MVELRWRCVSYSELTTDELYALLRLRAAVFVVEQACPYQDLDGYDDRAWHLLGHEGDALVAYARLFPSGVTYPEASVGRIVTSPAVRRDGRGRALMREALAQLTARVGPGSVRIGAQRYLEGFYAEFGFRVDGPPYDEDGIPHVHMVRPAAEAV